MDTLDILLGNWRLERSIEDRRAEVTGSFTGVASLTCTAPAGGSSGRRATYRETGRLSFGRYRGPAARGLEYVEQPDGTVLLCFTDGRPYIEVDLRTGACARVHDCGADRYEIRFDVLADGVLEERWLVRGPSKDYESLTTLTRDQRRSAVA